MMPTFASLSRRQGPGEDRWPRFLADVYLGSEQPELADRFLYWEFNHDGLQRNLALG